MDGCLVKPIDFAELRHALAGLAAAGASECREGAPRPAGFDLERALRLVGGDRTLLESIVPTFLAEAPALAARLDDALRAGDAAGTARAAHSLKGSASALCADAVEELARAIETRAREGRLEDCHDLRTRLAPALDELAGALEVAFDASRS
jgi:HPt (histidine-containing phosphotransfer) domain-containing protein